MMKRVGIAGALLVTVLALSAISVTAASADICEKVENAKEGNHNVAGCADAAAALGEYVLWEKAYFLKETLWCAEALPTEFKQKWANASCSVAASPVDTGGYAIVNEAANGALILPTPTSKEPLMFESKSNNEKNVLEGEVAGSAIECKAATSSGEFTSADLGKGTITFTGCKSAINGAKCGSLSDTAGTILVAVDWHLVDTKVSSVLRLALAAILLVLLHVECGATLLILVGNTVLGLFTKVAESGVKTKTGEIAFKQTKGTQELKECEAETAFCVGQTFGLYAELGKGREKAGEQSEDTITLSKEAAFDY